MRNINARNQQQAQINNRQNTNRGGGDSNEGDHEGKMRGVNVIEDQYFKKQMDFRGGRLHQLITDQVVNSNTIYANRYQGGIGVWYFFIDSTIHFENILAFLLYLLIQLTEFDMIDASFPVVALSINILLMALRNVVFEMRQRTVTNQINNKGVELLWITRKFKKYVPASWAECKPGHIIQIKSGQEFPADCLLLDISGLDQKCYVTTGPFDDSTGIIQKRSYAATSLKVGTAGGNANQNSEHIAEMVSGLLKFEYNYFGYIQGSFKLNENPTAIDFDQDNVVQRGSLLTHTSRATCLVLNVGDQCMGSVYKDPKSAMDTSTHQRLKSFVKTQRSFDKAYKQSVRTFLLSLALAYMVLSFVAIYLASTERFFFVASFEQAVIENTEISTYFYFKKGMGFFSILLSSIPLSFSNIIDLLVLMHTNFAEWDVDITPADIDFIQPHATLAFGKVAHMFFSRRALQVDDKQAVKLFHVGGHFYKNQVQIDYWRRKGTSADTDLDSSGASHDETGDRDQADEDEVGGRGKDAEVDDLLGSAAQYDSANEELSLEYLPNEIKFTQKFRNSEADAIMNGPEETPTRIMLREFFRAITLCHQINVLKDSRQLEGDGYQYVGVFNDEIASLEFAKQQNFQLIKRSKKLLTVILQGQQERYEELGVVTTKAVMGHFMTISATRLQGQQAGTLYMKGSIASLKPYFVAREKDFQYLNLFEQKFIQSGLHAVVYAKRQLTIEETNQLIITINEGIQMTKENSKLDKLLQNLTSIQLEILGMLGVQRCVHLRNRVAVDDMVLNGVKPWIVSKEDEQTHMTCLNSMHIMRNCSAPLVINGTRERVVTDQIMNALKIVTDRMAARAQQQGEDDEGARDDEDQPSHYFEKAPTTRSFSTKKGGGSSIAQTKRSGRTSKNRSRKQAANEVTVDEDDTRETNQKGLRNVVVFTGRALSEITRDMTMQKAFMTLAYLSDIMIGSEVSPVQKQKLLKIAKAYVGEGEYAAAIVTTPEDQFMVNEADLLANLKVQGKSADFQAVVDVTMKDFSAVSYLLFKHGNQIQMRLSKAAQAFFYRSLMTFLILTTYMIESGFSGQLPFTNFYYYMFMLFIAPGEILVHSTFYKDVGYEYLYRIYGHYKYNFSFSLVEAEFVMVDSFSAVVDWAVIYLPFERSSFLSAISLIQSQPISSQAYNCYQVILLQLIFLFYFRNTAVQVNYSMTILLAFTLIGCGMILDDDGLVGTTQLFTSPALLLTLTFQLFALAARNMFVDAMSKLVIRRYADLHDWYSQIEDKLSFEEYEDPNQQFAIQQFAPLFRKINSSNIQNTLKLINLNMMKVPKSDALEQILDKVNTELAIDKRSIEYGGTRTSSSGASSVSQLLKKQTGEQSKSSVNHSDAGTQLALTSGSINSLTLTLNDMNQETEYQENKNLREIIYVRRQMLVFILTTALFSVFGLILTLSIDYTNIGIYYYLGLSFYTLIIYQILPKLTQHVSNTLLFYTIVVIFCYTIYTSNDQSLQPTGLIFVLALVAGLNHSYIYPTMLMILSSVLMHIFFSVLEDFENSTTNFNNTYRVCLWIFVAIVWSVYVYMQELEKKTSFVSGHKKVRNFQKLKQILNILVPSLVRDKIRSGKKNFSDDEGVVTIIFVDIHQFDSIVEHYKGQELLALLDQVYNAFDQLCDQYGLQKIETVGKTYMACGGLKSAERKIEQRLLNRHHSVRVTDFALEVLQFAKTIYLKNGKALEVQLGVHTGPVISGVVGDTKPQFSLIGDTVNKTSRVCSKGFPSKVCVSKETQHFLELYTNNLAYSKTMVAMKGIGLEPIFIVTVASRAIRLMRGRGAVSTAGADSIAQPMSVQASSLLKDEKLKNLEGFGALNESGEDSQDGTENFYDMRGDEGQTGRGGATGRGTPPDSHRNLSDALDEGNLDQQQAQFNEDLENESNKTGLIDEGTMNVFGFNDDLNLDDRIIVQNATDNQIYQVVERPKYLMTFDQKDLEQDFLYQISKAESRKTTIFLALLIVLNKVSILADILQDGGDFAFTYQFYCMFPIFLFELLLIYKLNNPTLEYVHVWTYSLLVYGIAVLLVLLTFQAKYIGQWTRAGFNELQIQLTLSIIFFMRNVMLRHFLITYIVYMVCWIAFLVVVAQEFYYQIPQFIIGQIMYALLLAVGIHHREMIQRKSLNYERILNVEINKTNDIISNLVPYHMVNVIKNQKKHVDEFHDCTLLFTDMVKFTAFSKNAKDPREVVNLLSKLFSRFDQLCEQNKVYKVHTIGDCYVIMGYNGRMEKSRRNLAAVVDETTRVIETGLEMIEIISEVRNASENLDLKELDMRIGVHTGRVVAGIIGSKVVRYDIFGEGVLIANKMESNGNPGQVCVSSDTRDVLMKNPETVRIYSFTPHNTVALPKINRTIQTFIVDHRSDSFDSQRFGSISSGGDDFSEQEESSGGDLESEDDAHAEHEAEEESGGGEESHSDGAEEAEDIVEDVSDSAEHAAKISQSRSAKNFNRVKTNSKGEKPTHKNQALNLSDQARRKRQTKLRMNAISQSSEQQTRHRGLGRSKEHGSMKSNSSVSQLTFAGPHVQPSQQEVEIFQSCEASMTEEEGRMRDLVSTELADMIIEKSERMYLTDKQIAAPWTYLCVGVAFLAALTLVSIGTGHLVVSESTGTETLIMSDKSVINYHMSLVAEAAARRDLVYWAADGDLPITRAVSSQKYNAVLVFEHQHAHDPHCLYSYENMNGMTGVERYLRNNPRFEDFCLAESPTNGSCSSNSFISLQDMFKEYQSPDFDIQYSTQAAINETFVKVHSDPVAWSKYYKHLEKNYTLEDFRPHFVRTFINFGIPLQVNDVSNYTQALREMEDEIYTYQKELQQIVALVNKTNITADLFAARLTSELLRERESDEVLYADAGKLKYLLVVYAILVVLQLRSFISAAVLLLLGAATVPYARLLCPLPITRYQSSLGLLFAGIYFDSMILLVFQWTQASRVRYLRLDWRRRLAYVVAKSSRGLLTAKIVLSLSFLLVIVNRFDFVMWTALGLLAWNLVELSVVVLLIPPVIVVYYAYVLAWLSAAYESCLLAVKSSFKRIRFREYARRVTDRAIDDLNMLEDAHNGIPHEQGNDNEKARDVDSDSEHGKRHRRAHKGHDQDHDEDGLHRRRSDEHTEARDHRRWKDRQIQRSKQLIGQHQNMQMKAQEASKMEGAINQDNQVDDSTSEQKMLALLTDNNMTYMQSFMLYNWNRFVFKYRWAIIGIVLAWCILAFINVMKLTSNDLLPYINHLSNTYPVEVALWQNEDRFIRANGEQLQVSIVYGLKSLERVSSQDLEKERTNPRAHEQIDKGNVIYDPAFDSLKFGYSQRYFLNTCDELRDLELVGGRKVTCWLEDFDTWFQTRGAERGQADVDAGVATKLPYSGDPTFFLEQLRIWAFDTDPGRSAMLDGLLAFNANRTALTYTKIIAESRADLQRHNVTQTKADAYEAWQTWVDNTKIKAPNALKSVFQTSEVWALLASERALVPQMHVMILINMSICFIAVLWSTKNFIVAALTAVACSVVATSVIGAWNLAGYRVDISANIIILVTGGFAFNYVTYFACFYASSPFASRNEKVGHALFEVGAVIVASFFTLLPTSLFLFLFNSGTMRAFGIMIIVALTTSLIISLLFLPSILHVFGPQENFGHVPQLSFSYLCAHSNFCQAMLHRLRKFKERIYSYTSRTIDPIFGKYNYPIINFQAEAEQKRLEELAAEAAPAKVTNEVAEAVGEEDNDPKHTAEELKSKYGSTMAKLERKRKRRQQRTQSAEE